MLRDPQVQQALLQQRFTVSLASRALTASRAIEASTVLIDSRVLIEV
jgi:hypothetical protein